MWSSLFGFLGQVLSAARDWFAPRQPRPEPEPVDAAAARQGTAAGAAANRASHEAGK